MNVRLDRAAGRLATAAGVLGIAAGLAQTTAGHHMGSWAGNKADPVPLGLLTVLLSVLALLAARMLLTGRAKTGGRRAALVAGQLLPAALCTSTVGRLWWLPGTLLLVSAALTVAAAPAAVAVAVVRAWPGLLTSALGGCLLLVAATAGPPMMALGFAAGLAVGVAPWLVRRSRPAAIAALVAGAVPFAVLTWWTLITPLAGALALLTGALAIRERTRTG